MHLFRQHTESALFASDLKFHISSLTTDDITSSLKYLRPEPIGGAKPEESLQILNFKLDAMVSNYRLKLRELIDKASNSDVNAERNICLALYFVSYFHLKNQSCQ